MKNRKGFTLTELLAVIVIMAILAIGAISGYTSMTRNSKKKAYESKISEIENAAIKYAKETNLSNSTTISVNKLVVQGYIQPDESTSNGLASISNPENNENMICNLVNINVNDDLYEAQYYKDKIDCEVAEQELADLDIKVVARKLVNGNITENLVINGNTTKWTKTDVVLIVSSDKYKDFVSVSYDFDGKTVTKQKNTPSSNTTYVETDYNKIAIEDVAIMFNSEVTITYNMADGSIHSRTILVRIDKEAPTARAVVSNDVTLGSTKKVSLYLDDANGSEVEGFRVGQSNPLPDAAPLIKDASRKDSQSAGDGVFAGYNSYFYGKRGRYYVEVKDFAGNTFITPAIDVANFETSGSKGCELTVAATDGENRSYWTPDQIWFNKDITVTGTSYNAIGTMGIKYKLLQKNDPPVESNLTDFFDPKNQEKNLVATLPLSTESLVKKYYLGMKGLSRDEPVTYCDREIGLDKSDPVVSIACKSDDCDTYLKTHDITITLTDMWSGFSDAAKKIEIGWSTSNTTAPTEWKEITGGTISKYKVGSKEFSNGKVTFNTSLNGYSDSRKLTGIYYLWVNKDSFSDIAQNRAGENAVSSFSIKYDNTNPSCTSSGGKTAWQKAGFSIYGDCSDPHSGCATHTKSGNTTYDANGDITKAYSNEIDSDSESPGTVYDKAGNHTDCPSTQDVHIDLHDPTCTSSGGGSSWYNSNGVPVVIKGTCADTGGSGCAKKTIDGYTYDNNGNVSRSYSSNINSTTESPGTVYDNAGRSAVCGNRTVKIDIEKPTVTSVTVASQNSSYNTAKVNATVKGTDTGGSGISEVCIQTNDDVTKCSWKNFDGDETINDVEASKSLNGKIVFFNVWTKDTAGNISDNYIKVIRYIVYNDCVNKIKSESCGNDYGTCSNVCGGGTQHSTLTEVWKDRLSGHVCETNTTPNSSKCPRNCGGTEKYDCGKWVWSDCSKACGNGTKKQTRSCKLRSSVDHSTACDPYTTTEEQSTGTSCKVADCKKPDKPTITAKRSQDSILQNKGAKVASGNISNGLVLTWSSKAVTGGVGYKYKIGSGSWVDAKKSTSLTYEDEADNVKFYVKAYNLEKTSLESDAAEYVMYIDTTPPTTHYAPNSPKGGYIGDNGIVCPTCDSKNVCTAICEPCGNHKFVYEQIFYTTDLKKSATVKTKVVRSWLQMIYGNWKEGNNYYCYGNGDDTTIWYDNIDIWANSTMYGSVDAVHTKIPYSDAIQIVAWVNRRTDVHIRIVAEDEAGNVTRKDYASSAPSKCNYKDHEYHPSSGTPGEKLCKSTSDWATIDGLK